MQKHQNHQAGRGVLILNEYDMNSKDNKEMVTINCAKILLYYISLSPIKS